MDIINQLMRYVLSISLDGHYAGSRDSCRSISLDSSWRIIRSWGQATMKIFWGP